MCNNPGNLRASPNFTWIGQSPISSNGFCSFTLPVYGIRAMIKTLIAYHQLHGCSTLGDYIMRYAPPSENDTVKYIDDVSHRTGIAGDAVVNIPSDLPKLLQAIIMHEQGACSFTPLQLTTWVRQFYNPLV